MQHGEGGYRFTPGISAYSGGVIAEPGGVLNHVTLRRRVGWQQGFDKIAEHLAAHDRPSAALCAVELRCPRPHPFDGFGSFNAEYRAVLESWGVLLGDQNPVARTNVAPMVDPPNETELHAFTFTSPAASPSASAGGRTTSGGAPSFVIAGAGDLVDQSDLRPEAIVAPGDRSADGMRAKVACVLGEMEARMSVLGVGWSDVDVVDVYTDEPLQPVIESALVAKIGATAGGAITWYRSRPPIEGLDFEMDVRGGCRQTWI